MRVIILFLFSLILFSCKKEQTFTNIYSSSDNFQTIDGWYSVDSIRLISKKDTIIQSSFGIFRYDVHFNMSNSLYKNRWEKLRYGKTW